MKAYSLLLAFAFGFLLRECSCVVWGPKESPSGVRGHGQKTPQVFDLAKAFAKGAEEQLDDVEEEDMMQEFSTMGSQRFKRQSATSIGYTARLTNDNHYQAVVHWTGHPSEDIFILTRKLVGANGHSAESWLWRSTDYGHSFINETYKLPSDAIAEWYYISPYSEFLIFTDIGLNRLYITENEGDSYTPVNIPFTPSKLLFQSIQAPNSTDAPYNKYVLGFDSSTQMLWVSMDLGYNWVKIGENVPYDRFYWRRLGSDIEGDLSTVYYEQMTNENSSMLYVWNSGVAAGQLGQVFSPNIGEFRSRSFVLEREYMFVQKPETTNVAALLSPLWVSHNRNSTFVQAEFPFVTEKQHYSVIDASEGQVFIAVYHIGNTSNLYISEEKGVSYSLTLQDIVSPPEENWINGNPTIDVHVVEGVVGTYFANRHPPDKDYGTTVVSFDKGGIWNPLTPPAVKWNGQPVTCAPPACSVHLHMDIDAEYSSYQTILSQDTAIGLIMALGNFGRKLASNYRRLYFSRDGGFTWAEVKRAFWEFQFAALGSIVVAVQKNTRVSSVLWSCDEGATWHTSNFVNGSSTYVIGMRTEAGEKSRHVTIFGYNNGWLVYDLDFTSVVPNQCNPDEDYYDWIPTDERPGSRCLLGEVVAYERRNASECCYVDPNYEKGIERNPCECAIEDFECDFGFERDNLNSPCTPYPGLIYPPDPPTPCLEGNNYTYTSGYRKIAGDKCIPGEETYFFPITRPCPIKPPRFLVINSPGQAQAGAAVTFSLTQFDGAVVNTRYTWNYNDSTVPVTVYGLTNAQSQTHTFTQPGVYTVSMTAENEGGSAEVVQTVRVLDTVTSVQIDPPSQTFNKEVPTTISLLFTAEVGSEYNTDMLDIREYQWDFGDGSDVINSHIATVSHTFSSPGTYTVRLTIHAPFVSGSSEDTLTLTAYEASSVVNVVPTSSGMISTDGTTYVLVNAQVTFSPEPRQSNLQLPPDTVNTWHIVKTNPTEGDDYNFTVANLLYTFTSWGEYHISVIARSDVSGANFVGELFISAESEIASVSAEHTPTTRTGSIISFAFTVRDSANAYEGPLTVSVIFNNTVLASSISISNGQLTRVSLEASGRGALEYKLIAQNHISSVERKTILNVVDTGDYASLTIKFSNVPSTFINPAWQGRLKISVLSAIAKLNLQLELVDVAAIRIVEENATSTDSSDLLKRAAEGKKETFVYVDVNILPTEYSPEATAQTFQLAKLVVNEAVNGSFVVIVDGQTLTIVSAHVGTGGIIIEPPIIINRFDTQKYAAIGGALGGFLLLALVIAVVLVVIVYFYRRKYSRLHVRYSRVHQNPVKFSFTPGGEMIEDDDDDDDLDGENI